MILVSTKPQTRFESAIPADYRSQFADAAWIYPGTVNRMLAKPGEGVNGLMYLPTTPGSRDAWHAAAKAAAAAGFTEVVIDAETPGNSLVLARTNGVGPANLATDLTAWWALWVREAAPELSVGFYHACPAPPAMPLTEDTPDDVEADFVSVLTYERDRLAADFCVLEDYEYGQDWRADLTFWNELAQRYYPGKPRRVLLTPLDQKTGLYVGDATVRKWVRQVRRMGCDVEFWFGDTPADVIDSTLAVAAEVADKN